MRVTDQRTGEAGDQLDEIGLAAGAGLAEQAMQVRLTVASAMPSASAVSATPPTWTMASSTRSSLGVELRALAMTSGGEGASSAALCTNRAATAA